MSYDGRILRGSSEVSFQTWRDALNKIQSEKKRLAENSGIMTPLEKKDAREKIEGLKQAFQGAIISGIIDEVMDLAHRVQSHERIVKSYQRLEAEGWDPATMQLAYKSVENRLNNASQDPFNAGAKCEEVFKEAQNSKYELRAFSELAPERARINKDIKLNRLAIEAARQLRELRETDDILAKKRNLNEVIVEFGDRLKDAKKVHREIYDGEINDPFHVDPLSRTFRRFLWNDGELEILPESDGRVTGIYWENGMGLKIEGG